MKVAALKAMVIKDKLVFEIEKPVKEISVDELDKDGKLTKDLKTLGLQRYLIRKSTQISGELRFVKF